MRYPIDRREFLRGSLAGAAVTVGLPYLDIFLNANGTALASGAPLPRRFGTWFFGCGMNPERWAPTRAKVPTSSCRRSSRRSRRCAST